MLALLCVSLVLVVVNNTIVNVALPTISRELGASTTDLQWIVDAYALTFSALLLSMGHFGDRFGRRRALRLGLLVFAATSAAASQADGTGQLIAAAAAMGLGAALVFPATLAILVTVFTDLREQAVAIGIWTACTGLAVALGPVTGGLLLDRFWWGSVGAVPADQAGVGSAVNDTIRELGGTLGVAVVGSVFAGVFADRLGAALAGQPLPEPVFAQAQQSLAAALTVAGQLPAGLGGPLAEAAREAFMAGLARGSLIAAGATAVGAVVAAMLLPSRHRGPDDAAGSPSMVAVQAAAGSGADR